MKLLAITLILFAGAVTSAADEKRAKVLIQAAEAKETVQGDLKAAIQLYGEAVKEAGPNRALAAASLLRMGECYEKMGNSESQRIYERILRDYADQKESAGAASAKLGRKTVLMTRLVMDSKNASPGLYLESIHPDGRLAVGEDWSNGNLCIRDMVTGNVRVLLAGSLQRQGNGITTGRYVAWTFISPNQKQVAFSRYGDPGNPSQGQLWVIPMEPGSKPRLLNRNSDFRVQGWSPDNHSVLSYIILPNKGGYQFAWISAVDGSVKIIKSGSWERAPDFELRLSPDGKYIAYSGRPPEGSRKLGQTQIRIVAADGSAETVITTTAGYNAKPEWTPDGAHIVFLSDRAGTPDLWAIPVRNGRAVGRPSVVKRDIPKSMTNLGMTRSGTYYYEANNSVNEIYITDIKVMGRLQETLIGRGPGLSPDGKRVAFYRRSPSGLNVVVHSLETGEEKIFLHDGLLPPPPIWFHDGKSILVTTIDKARTLCTIYRVDLATGQFDQVLQLEARLAAGDLYTLSLDDKTLYVAGRETPGGLDNRIVAYELVTGRHRDVFTARGGMSPPHLSPDGRTLSFIFLDGAFSYVACVGTDGTNYRELYKDRSGAIAGITWTHDGRALLFGQRHADKTWQIMSVPVTGGDPVPLGLRFERAPADMSISRDGSRLSLCTTGSADEVWAIDNILSAAK